MRVDSKVFGVTFSVAFEKKRQQLGRTVIWLMKSLYIILIKNGTAQKKNQLPPSSPTFSRKTRYFNNQLRQKKMA